MPSRSAAHLAVVLAAASVLAGCSSAGGTGGAGGSPAPLQFRLVTSSTDGPCSAPPLTSNDPGSACGESGTTTYQVGASLGEITPTAATYPGGQAVRQTISLTFDQAGSAKLGEITGSAIGKQLAVLVAGRVLNAPHVEEAITSGSVQLGTTTPAETAQLAAALHASATS
ncbi:MAG TPA: hypothetical protein VMV41_13730 [Cellulomonadaceae bacterium]|nr:hypothetical protein [Cellulomonadaceae bacterium]